MRVTGNNMNTATSCYCCLIDKLGSKINNFNYCLYIIVYIHVVIFDILILLTCYFFI